MQVPQRMIECGLATDENTSHKRASQFIKASVDRAKAAIAKYNKGTETECVVHQGECKQLIAGCVPPLSECYFANKVPTTLDSLISEYTVILTTLLECNVDILLAETLSTKREAVSILQSVSNIIHQKNQSHNNMTIPLIWISFTIHDDEPTKLRSDESLEIACQSIIQEANNLNLSIDALGINCSTPRAISQAVPILTKVTEGTNIKVCAYGNCFRTTTSEWINSLGVEDDTTNDDKDMKKAMIESCDKDYDEDGYLLPSVYANFATEWIKSGAQIIGGCCGSRPKHMCKVATVLKITKDCKVRLDITRH